jgi:sugar lactone lactonase YvrE
MPSHALRTVLDDLVFTEGPRWHDGRLWCSDMHDHRVISTALDGHADTVVRVEDDEPSGLGWLPDGRLLVVAMETQRLLRVEPDGELAVHADLSSAARGSLNDMIVAADGTAYIGDMGVRIHELGAERRAGQTFRVAPDGRWECAADDLQSPNGHILTDDGRTLIVAESGGGRLTAFTVREDGTLTDRRTYAELTPARDDVLFAPPDGICLDAEGAVWVADPIGARVFRVREGGEVTDTIRFDDVIPVACVLGGPGRRTLFMCVAADWKRDVVRAARTGRIDAIEVGVPGAGRP